MAPSRSQPVKNGAGNRLAIPSKKKSLASITTTTTNNGHTLTTSSSTSDLNSGYLLPTALVPHPFERPMSSGSLPATPRFRKYRKNMKDFTGFDTTEDEFETLPLAVRRKVCFVPFAICCCCKRSSGRYAERTCKKSLYTRTHT
jgi:hypothetical protein